MNRGRGESSDATGGNTPLRGNYRSEVSSKPGTTEKRGLVLMLWAIVTVFAARLFPRSSISTSLLSLTSLGSIFLFFKLTDEVHEQGHGTTAFDQTVLTYFHQHWNPILNAAARLCAVLGSLEVLGLVTVIGIILGWRIPALRPAVRVMPVAAIVSLILLNIVKFSIHRVRPDLFPALFGAIGYSFPSGHAFLSVVIYGLFGFYILQLPRIYGVLRWCIGLFTLLFVLCIGVSRAYAGVHFPTDVLGGWAAGFPCLYILFIWSKWLVEKTDKLVQQTA